MPGKGAMPSPPDARDFRFSAAHYGGPSAAALPAVVDLRGGSNPTRLHPVGRPPNQQDLEACVGFSYGIQRAALRVAAGAPPIEFNHTYTWFYARQVENAASQNVGVAPRDVYDAALKLGCPIADIYPDNYGDWITPPPAAVISAARIYKIGSYHTLSGLQEVRQALAARCPVTATIGAGPDYDAMTSDGILNAGGLAYRNYNHQQVVCGCTPDWLIWSGTWGEGFGQAGFWYTPTDVFDTGFAIQPWAASLKVTP